MNIDDLREVIYTNEHDLEEEVYFFIKNLKKKALPYKFNITDSDEHSGIGDTVLSFTQNNYMQYFKLRTFPSNCGWLLMHQISGATKSFKDILKIAEWVASYMNYSAIVFSLNKQQADYFNVPERYKCIFSNKSYRTGNQLLLYVGDL